MQLQTLATPVTFPSDLGWCGLAVSRGTSGLLQLEKVTFGHATEVLARKCVSPPNSDEPDKNTAWESDPELSEWTGRLQEFAAGRFVDLSPLRLHLDYLTDFGRRVITACREIRWGETTSYGNLAQRVGSPGASRAVGGVMARNRHPLVVPCHRVIASNGALVGFSAPDGTRMKQRLLQNEKD